MCVSSRDKTNITLCMYTIIRVKECVTCNAHDVNTHVQVTVVNAMYTIMYLWIQVQCAKYVKKLYHSKLSHYKVHYM